MTTWFDPATIDVGEFCKLHHEQVNNYIAHHDPDHEHIQDISQNFYLSCLRYKTLEKARSSDNGTGRKYAAYILVSIKRCVQYYWRNRDNVHQTTTEPEIFDALPIPECMTWSAATLGDSTSTYEAAEQIRQFQDWSCRRADTFSRLESVNEGMSITFRGDYIPAGIRGDFYKYTQMYREYRLINP